MTPPFFHPWFVRGLRWIVGGVFLYAGAIKIGAPQDFADSIAGFRLLPALLVNALALGLPPFELLASLMLLTGWRWRAAALAVLLMTTVFALAMISALARGLQIDCGCFGGGGLPSRWQTAFSLGRDFLLIGAALFLRRAADRENPRSP